MEGLRWLLLLPMLACAQTKPEQPLDARLTLRFDESLVQVDAVVTGRDGRRAAGLSAGDFEVLQDGKQRNISQFSYVSAGGGARRTVAVVVDDIYLEFGAYSFVRQALARFIDEELRPGDLMSLVYTSRGSGALRQFTSDRQLLHRALERMYWRPPSAVEDGFPGMALLREMNNAIDELGGFPGKKSLVMIAPGSRAQLADVRGIADLANRSSVTVYGVDARGLPAPLPSAGTGMDASSARGSKAASSARNRPRSAASQETLSLLSEATGGLFLPECNGALDQLRIATEDSAGYYLIGWHPGEDAFKRNSRQQEEYHRVQIRVRDKSLRVRTREGYFGRMGTNGPQVVFSAREQMRQALASVFNGGGIEVSLTSQLLRQEAVGSLVASLIHVGAKGVRFEQDSGGCWSARLELARAVWPVDPWVPNNDRVNSDMLDVRACGKEAERVLAEGFVAGVVDRVPSPGTYQVRAAVRNAELNERSSFGPVAVSKPGNTQPLTTPVGSATQFLLIPDLKKSRFALSGLTVWSGGTAPAPSADIAYRPLNGSDPAVRHFRAADELHYSLRVLGDADGVKLRLQVLRDGKEVTATPDAPATGKLSLKGLSSGAYVLGVIASSPAAKKIERAEQWIDFEVR